MFWCANFRNGKSIIDRGLLLLMSTLEYNDRASLLLKTLIETYIKEGQPVGSKMLARTSELALSSASIRKMLADLETKGLLSSPHTSAGRVPTEQGFRLFVDTLAIYKPLDEPALSEIEARLEASLTTSQLIESASNLLAETTQLTGLVMLPRTDQVSLRQVEFLPLSGSRVLVVLVVNEKEVQNRIITTDREYSEIELQQAANFVNQHFAGGSLSQIREQLLSYLEQDKDSLNQLLETTLEVANKAFSDGQDNDDYVVAGETNLFQQENYDVDRLRGLLEAFNRKRDILFLMDRCIEANDTQIFIGAESGTDALVDCSVVTAPYCLGEKVLGVLAVVGPTRMDYQKVVPTVDITAKILSTALNQS